MNAVEIEEAVSQLAEQEYDAAEFPYAFLEAFGNKANTIKRLRSSGKNTTNKTDIEDDGVVAVLQRNNIHIATLDGGGPDAVGGLLKQMADSQATAKHKAKFALATDGQTIQAENLKTGETLVCDYAELADHFGFFLELAGISTIREIRENAFDIKATGRLNRLYVELLRHNPDWDSDERREDLNHFFARLIFCFFAEDTGIFRGDGLFTESVRQMSEPSGGNMQFVLAEIFRAMDVPAKDRDTAQLRSWAEKFPYVNGGLFGGGTDEQDVPIFSQIARSYLLHIGSLDWTHVNPDIFGSMIQAVAEDEERGALGMHYTSVPNILKVLNPLFLDDLRAKLGEAGENPRKLLNLRKRLARIRVFDPACGSGNFLVIAYKQMREIEAEINQCRGEADRATDIPLTNFRGIEIRHFSAEVARLALVIAEYQCDELYRGQRLALAEFLPLDNQNWITHGNALRLDWLKACPPSGSGGVKLTEDDLFQTPLAQPEIDFENEGGETYICGNPPYLGSRNQSDSQRDDLRGLFENRLSSWRSLDYVAGWFIKAADYGRKSAIATAFVSTNSICQGLQVPLLWPLIFKLGQEIAFAHLSFKWSNLASHNAGVTVVVVGMTNRPTVSRRLYMTEEDGVVSREAQNINAYLVPAENVFVEPIRDAPSGRPEMLFGNMPRDGGALCLSPDERKEILQQDVRSAEFIKRYLGSAEMIQGKQRYCLWIESDSVDQAKQLPLVSKRLKAVEDFRLKSKADATRGWANRSFRFVQIPGYAKRFTIAVAGVSSERREYLPVDLLSDNAIISNLLFGIYDAPLWNIALIASKLHLVWIATVCGKLKTDYRYSNTLGWNTFPVPSLSNQNKTDLTRCAEDILLARETHWPATIAELYDHETMPEDLRTAHDRNDETLERIYIGRRFTNDTERLETLFQMYSETASSKQKTSTENSEGDR